MKLFDAHCHLQDERLAARREDVLARAAQANVVGMVCNGSNERDWDSVRALAAASPAILPAFGLHPWHIDTRTPGWLETLSDRLVATPTASVGEIGLDHVVQGADLDAQHDVFLRQLELAALLDRPVSLHCRRAWNVLIAALGEAKRRPRALMIHSYSGSADLIPSLAKLPIGFSFSGSLTYDHHRHVREAAARAPLDRLLIETDAPDIPPMMPGRHPGDPPRRLDGPNEPAHLVLVLNALAAIRGIPSDELAGILHANATRLFLGKEG